MNQPIGRVAMLLRNLLWAMEHHKTHCIDDGTCNVSLTMLRDVAELVAAELPARDAAVERVMSEIRQEAK